MLMQIRARRRYPSRFVRKHFYQFPGPGRSMRRDPLASEVVPLPAGGRHPGDRLPQLHDDRHVVSGPRARLGALAGVERDVRRVETEQGQIQPAHRADVCGAGFAQLTVMTSRWHHDHAIERMFECVKRSTVPISRAAPPGSRRSNRPPARGHIPGGQPGKPRCGHPGQPLGAGPGRSSGAPPPPGPPARRPDSGHSRAARRRTAPGSSWRPVWEIMATMEIRLARPADWPAIWPIWHEVVAAGETYTWDPQTDEATARALWLPPLPAASAGRGVGRRLAEHVVTRATLVGYRGMQFNAVVSTNERAVALWKALGFEIVATIPEGFRHARLGYVDLYIMYRRLSP